MKDPEQLQDHFAISNVLRFDRGKGGLTRIAVNSELAEAHVYLHGAHVTHFQPRGHAPVLMVSSRSHFETGKPIRGGIPVAFPWFARRADKPEAPLHGLVRTDAWTVESVSQESSGIIRIIMIRASDEFTQQEWPGEFDLRYTIEIGTSLNLSLEACNAGDQPFRFEEALHTYFHVGDITKVSLHGLQGARYLDKNDAGKIKTMQAPTLQFNGKADLVFQNTAATCVIDDPVEGRRITVAKESSRTTVVWNPWKDHAMPDLGEEDWRHMLCVETVNAAENAITLPPRQKHIMRATIDCEM